MLGFSDEEKRLITASQRHRSGAGPSLASDVAGNANGKASLADQWVDFLVEQVQQGDGGAGSPLPRSPRPPAPGAGAAAGGALAAAAPLRPSLLQQYQPAFLEAQQAAQQQQQQFGAGLAAHSVQAPGPMFGTAAAPMFPTGETTAPAPAFSTRAPAPYMAGGSMLQL